mgnify:CR=1 FL=1
MNRVDKYREEVNNLQLQILDLENQKLKMSQRLYQERRAKTLKRLKVYTEKLKKLGRGSIHMVRLSPDTPYVTFVVNSDPIEIRTLIKEFHPDINIERLRVIPIDVLEPISLSELNEKLT